MGTFKDLENELAKVGDFLAGLKVFPFMQELVNDLSKDFRTARDRALEAAATGGTGPAKRLFKYTFRELAGETIDEFWNGLPWYYLLIKPFVMPPIMKGFRWCWERI